MKTKKKRERVDDFRAIESELYWLRRSATFQAYLDRCRLIREKEEWSRLTLANRAVMNWRMTQCCPVLAMDDSTGLRGWERGTVNGYFVDGVFHECRSESLKEHYDAINKNDIPCVTVWKDCPFDSSLNGKEY